MPFNSGAVTVTLPAFAQSFSRRCGQGTRARIRNVVHVDEDMVTEVGVTAWAKIKHDTGIYPRR